MRLSRILVLAALLAAGWAVLGDRVAGEERDGRVLRVIDGDTLVVRVGGEPRRVRLLGIDTPERGECGFGRATRALRRLAGDRRVVLEADPTQDREDRYGRLLAYVRRRGAERTAQEALLRAGWAEVYVARRPFRRFAAFRAAERAAARARRGVHGRCWTRRRSTARPAPPQACSRCNTASCSRRSSPRASRPEPFSRPASPAGSSS